MTASRSSARRPRQLRLRLDRSPSYAREDFIVSSSNAAAVAALDAWPAWPGGRLALVGPDGVGKTHLARSWAERVGAAIVETAPTDVSFLRSQAILVEDVDRRGADETLFHLINMADHGATLLLTGRGDPESWATDVPDLRSRLNALTVARIEPPDDDILTGVLRKFFRERNIRPASDVAPYLIHRIERSIPAVRQVVRRIDEFADEAKRDITRTLARQILECEDNTLDLFD